MTLSSAFNISLSGMNAAVVAQSAASNNMANTLSPDYRRLAVSQSEVPTGGVEAKRLRLAQVGENLVDDAVGQIGALYSFKANILALRVADQMVGTVLNTHA
jgi:flagellar basal body rod protein FlgC